MTSELKHNADNYTDAEKEAMGYPLQCFPDAEESQVRDGVRANAQPLGKLAQREPKGEESTLTFNCVWFLSEFGWFNVLDANKPSFTSEESDDAK